MSTEITIAEAAHILSVSDQRVRTLCRQGTLSARKIGVSWLIDAQSIHKYALRTAHKIAEDHPVYAFQQNKPIALSFFSGAMGLDLGIEQAGFDIRLACEVDKYCRQTIMLNKPHMALIGDIQDYSPCDIKQYARLSQTDDIDLIIGGPPCQTFSTAGKRNGFRDERGNAFLTFIHTALALQPKYLVIENVRGLLSCPMQHRPHELRGPGYPDLSYDELAGGALFFVLNSIQRAGYAYSFHLYNAAHFGSPQIRERVVIVCSRDGKKPPYLTPTHAEGGQHGLLQWQTFREATQDLTEHHYIQFPEKRLAYYKMLKQGENWRSLPEELQKEALGKSYYAGGGKTGFLRRLFWDKPAPTLVTHPAMPATDLAHPEEDRPLSIEEYKRLQEFPDDWLIAGPLIEQYRQVGNAVPVSLGFAIGTLLQNLLRDKRDKIVDNLHGFKYSRYHNTSDIEWLEGFSKGSKKNELIQTSLF